MTYPAMVSRQMMDGPTTPNAETAQFRPKVLRRPASLQEVTVTPAPEPVAAAARSVTHTPRQEPASPPASTASRPWQEDTRFGLVMVLVVLAVNLLLVFGLRHSGSPDMALPVQTSTPDTSAAAPVPEVTTYARPTEPNRQPRAVHLLGADDTPLEH